jgi:hypothetical protein
MTATSRGTWWGARYVPGLLFATAMMIARWTSSDAARIAAV